jgi:hypothetical protein
MSSRKPPLLFGKGGLLSVQLSACAFWVIEYLSTVRQYAVSALAVPSVLSFNIVTPPANLKPRQEILSPPAPAAQDSYHA